MNFLEEQFPSSIALGATGGPAFSTEIIQNFGGFEQRNINWKNALGRWNLATAISHQNDIQTLISFFRKTKGRAIGFRFKDWSDYSATKQSLEPIATGKYQIIKHYRNNKREIKKPVQGSVKLYQNDIRVESGWDLDATTGIMTTAIEGDLTIDFEFDVPVRFDVDHLNITMETGEYGHCPDIPLVEVRL